LLLRGVKESKNREKPNDEPCGRYLNETP